MLRLVGQNSRYRSRMIEQHGHAPLIADLEQILRKDKWSDLMEELDSNGDEDVDWDDWALDASKPMSKLKKRGQDFLKTRVVPVANRPRFGLELAGS